MPKVLIFKLIWIFVIFNTDIYENRKHIHVGKKGTIRLCKIWLEPSVSVADPGDLTLKQQNDVLKITQTFLSDLLKQWDIFRMGQKVKTIIVK